MSYNRIILQVLLAVTFCMPFHAKELTLDFSLDDFRFSFDSDGKLFVGSNNLKAFYSEECKYALPSIMFETEVENSGTPSLTIKTSSSRVVYQDIQMSNRPLPYAVGDDVRNGGDAIFPLDIDKDRKMEICQIVGSSDLKNGKTKVNMIINPFIYDEENETLRMYSNISIELINQIDKPKRTLNMSEINQQGFISYIRNYLYKVSTENSDMNEGVSRVKYQYRPAIQGFDYLIITSSELVNSFIPLMEWKDKKGIATVIIPVDTILAYPEFSGTAEERIKTGIYLLKQWVNIKYVLLGGDDNIIPVKRCFGKVLGGGASSDIPTDLYYSCFDGAFNWDGNNNGIYGEVDDGIDLTPSVYLTRVPVRTNDDVDAFVKKILKYEQNPELNYSMLMCGRALTSETPSISDADQKGRNLLGNHISQYWKGRVVRLYDTSTSFAGNADYHFNNANFMPEINKGHSFIDIITKGSYNCWNLETGLYVFLNAMGQNNKNSTFVISSSSDCNAFDKSTTNSGVDQSVSEFMINNIGTGVVGFLGSSRENWEYVGSSELGPNLQYNAWFYEKLFSNPYDEKNFGKVVASAKAALASASYQYGPYRWLHFALNPIGDPETPIFTLLPMTFSNNITLENNGFRVTTDTYGIRICIKSLEDGGEGIYEVYENKAELFYPRMSQETSVCLTKAGYIPQSFLLYNFQNTTIKDRDLKGHIVRIGRDILPQKEKGNVSIEGHVTISAPTIEIYGGTEICKGATVEITN